MKGIDITGQRFGRLVAVSMISSYPARYWQWLCKCDCGNETKAYGHSLRSGDKTSCGCRKREIDEALKTSMVTHGMWGSATYVTWDSMIQRCSNKGSTHYHCYGGRGITVCERWKAFENFLADMGERPDAMSLDRINNDGNYEPGNCRWATRTQQNENKRTTKLAPEDVVKIRERCANGERHRLVAADYGLARSHVSNIVKRLSWRHIP